MKKTLIINIFILLFVAVAESQVPQDFSYQAVVRDRAQIIDNQRVSLLVSIIQHVPNGPVVYQEKHSAVTNRFGLVNLTIGAGEVRNGNFADIAWAEDQFFIKTEIDLSGGENFVLNNISEPIWSVPYALVAKNVQTGIADADSDTTNEIQQLKLNGYNLSAGDTAAAVDLSFIADGTADSDADPGNELLAMADITEDQFSLIDAAGTKTVAIAMPLHDADHDAANEVVTGLEIVDDTLLVISQKNQPDITVDLSFFDNNDMDINDADHDPANEIQGLLMDENILYLTKDGEKYTADGYQVDFSRYLVDSQSVSATRQGDIVTIAINGTHGGNSVEFGINDHDADTTNELQALHEVLQVDNDAGGKRMTNVADPVNPGDMANKRYVDQVFGDLEKQKIQERGNFMWYGRTWGKFYDPVNDEVYKFTQIGDQVWMGENLRSLIPQGGSTPIEGFNYNAGIYTQVDLNNDGNHDEEDSLIYTRLYGLQYDLTELNNTQLSSICPNGWRLPTIDDFNEIKTYLTGQGLSYNLARYLLDYNDTYWDNLTHDAVKIADVAKRDLLHFSLRGAGNVTNGNLNFHRYKTMIYLDGANKTMIIGTDPIYLNIDQSSASPNSVAIRCIKNN
jgi:uncharacterized protein (TIGR02145 family)